MAEFTNYGSKAIAAAQTEAASLGHNYIGSEHILLGILTVTDSLGAQILMRHGVNYENYKKALVAGSGVGTYINSHVPVKTITAQKILAKCGMMMSISGNTAIGTEHILMAILSTEGCVACKLLVSLGVSNIKQIFDEAKGEKSSPDGVGTAPSLSDEIDKEMRERAKGISDGRAQDSPRAASGKSGGTQRSGQRTPELDKYGTDLTALAYEGKLDPVIGRDEETARVIEILSRRNKNTPCLIGEPGVGKTAVVEGLALLIAGGNVPETVKGKRVVTLDLTAMLAGAKYRGEFEERIKSIIDEVKAAQDVILFIDEIHTIVGAGATEGALDAANILKPALARGEIKFIGATTLNEYRKSIEKDTALERRFGTVMVDEPTPDEAILILKGLRAKYEDHHKIEITDEAIEAAVQLSVRYISDKFLPDKAIDLIDETCARIRIQGSSVPFEMTELERRLSQIRGEIEAAVGVQAFEKASELSKEERRISAELDELRAKWRKEQEEARSAVTKSDIADTVTSRTGIPVNKLADEEQGKLLGLADELRKRVIGQDEAVDVVARAVRRGRMGLKDPKRPQGSFIFCGPTGVGKTELSKALAEAVFGDEKAIVRIDMSEYMEKHSVSKLIGAPPGYVGYDEGGQLTEKIRRKPYSVVLFDEIEKAHPDVFNIMLQVLDDGQLTDSQGRRVDFKNTVIIMTSNLGSSSITETRALGFSAVSDEKNEADKTKEVVMKALKDHFRPEFLNRIDEIVIFNKLGSEDITKITRIMLKDLIARIEGLGVKIRFTDEVCKLLAEAGFDPVYGARPLKRAIQQKIEDSFSTALLEDKINPGDSIVCDANDGEIVYLPEDEMSSENDESDNAPGDDTDSSSDITE